MTVAGIARSPRGIGDSFCRQAELSERYVKDRTGEWLLRWNWRYLVGSRFVSQALSCASGPDLGSVP